MDESTHSRGFGHETSDASIDPIVLTGVGLAVVAAIVFFLVFGIFRFLQSHPTATSLPNPMAGEQERFPAQPRIEEHPSLELRDLHAQEDATLSTYGWVDKKSGVVRVPIERAMELQLQRGYPTRKEAPKP